MTVLKHFATYLACLTALIGGFVLLGQALRLTAERFGSIGLAAFFIVLLAAIWAIADWTLER